ncbi:MAG: pseudaminic acid synthase [Proteobacteria bacterium]|nr:pseudaminic acid synthase [Pseudomonadota bacterium]
MKLKINNRMVGSQEPPYIIAEMSANHNGSIERAFETIAAVKRCGADAVKLQTYTADTITIDCDEPDFRIRGGPWDGFKLYDLYKWAETPFEWHEELFAYARKLGITLFSTPFDETAVDLLESLNTPAYKIASFEIVDLPLIRYVAATGKPMIMSTGMSLEQEIDEAVTAARDAGCSDLILLHCISSYPAPMDQANLRQIPELARRFNVLTGLSDHTMGTAASVASVCLGACLIEKHFTLDRADKGPDSVFSIEPKELETLCKDAKDAWLALGVGGYQRQKAEEGSMVFRRSLYFVKDLPAGHVIEAQDIRSIRPGRGLPPKHLPKLIGRRLKVSASRGQPTSFDCFE